MAWAQRTGVLHEFHQAAGGLKRKGEANGS